MAHPEDGVADLEQARAQLGLGGGGYRNEVVEWVRMRAGDERIGVAPFKDGTHRGGERVRLAR